MSRTHHHRNQKQGKAGLDYGARYNCDKGYCAGYGETPKDAARSERRQRSKALLRDEIAMLECK